MVCGHVIGNADTYILGRVNESPETKMPGWPDKFTHNVPFPTHSVLFYNDHCLSFYREYLISIWGGGVITTE